METLGLYPFDLIITLVIIISGVIAFFRGFLQESLSLVLWICAFAAATFMNPYLDPYLSEYIANKDLKRFISLALVFVGVIFTGGFAIKLLRSLIHWSGLGGFDRLLGVLFGFLRGAVLIVIIYLILPAHIKQSDFIVSSKIAPILDDLAPKAENFFKDMISNKNSVMLDPNITSTSKT